MAKKNYYYVLVMTEEGPVFVTGFGEHHTCYWNAEKAPKTMMREYAGEVAMGLRLNGTSAYLVTMPYEVDTQPYFYEKGHFKWVTKDS